MWITTDNMFRLPDLDRRVYRIFRRHRLLELLQTSELVLVNPSMWDDPFENFFLKANAVGSDGQKVSLAALRASWYGQCWTFNRDSDAMWRIYGRKACGECHRRRGVVGAPQEPEHDGVRVATTVRKLFHSFYSEDDQFASLKCFAGAVDYRPRHEIESFLSEKTLLDVTYGGQNDGFAKLLCVKRPEFEHEAEIRIVFNDINDEVGDGETCKFRINVTEFIEETALDPRLERKSYERTRDELVKSGCPDPIIQSDLYRFDPDPINIQ